MFDPDESRTNLHCIVKAGQRREKVNFSRGLPRACSWLAPAISQSYQWRAVEAGVPGMVLRGIVAFVVLAVMAFFSFSWAHETRLTWFDTKPVLAAAAKYDATVVRDGFGVPHISGRRDADAAFGLAYAHAEDDFLSIQRAVLAARGRLATVDGVRAVEDDYLVQLLGIWDDIAARYETDLSPETRMLLDGYAAGLNLYAAQHRADVLTGFAPTKAQDVVALFMLRLPFFYGLDNQLRALIAGGSTKIAGEAAQERGVAIAVAPTRSADGATRLLINPQAPLSGPLSWYEAQIDSGEGWSMAGGLIPGSPVMLSGAGANSGWGISSNHPDLSDTYTLEANPNDRYFYRFDGEWRRLESRRARLAVRLWGPVRITLRREVLRSVQGPAIRNGGGLYAVHYAGQGDLKGIEAFFRLNKARDFDAFTAVLGSGDIPSLSFVYAEKSGRIAAIYNGAFPDRPTGYDWSRAVPGNISATLWKTYLPFVASPRTIAPASGFVIAADATPFRTTADPFNPKPESFPASQGIEAGMTNRARRAFALFSADKSITADKFRAYKFDNCYAPDSDLAVLVKEIGQRNYAGDPLLEEAGQILRHYDLCTNKAGRGAALALLTAGPLLRASARGQPRPDSVATLRATASRLLSQFARLDPTWGTINRLRRAGLDLPLSGAPDTLRSIEPQPRLRSDGTSTALAGDALAMFSTWTKDGRWQIESIVPFGSSTVAGTRHYADQAPLFADEKLKRLPLSGEELMAEATQIEKPGKPPPPKGTTTAPLPLALGPSAGLSVMQPANAGERKRKRAVAP
jgi:acyl-homoserine-lactone acylase